MLKKSFNIGDFVYHIFCPAVMGIVVEIPNESPDSVFGSLIPGVYWILWLEADVIKWCQNTMLEHWPFEEKDDAK